MADTGGSRQGGSRAKEEKQVKGDPGERKRGGGGALEGWRTGNDKENDISGGRHQLSKRDQQTFEINLENHITKIIFGIKVNQYTELC